LTPHHNTTQHRLHPVPPQRTTGDGGCGGQPRAGAHPDAQQGAGRRQLRAARAGPWVVCAGVCAGVCACVLLCVLFKSTHKLCVLLCVRVCAGVCGCVRVCAGVCAWQHVGGGRAVPVGPGAATQQARVCNGSATALPAGGARRTRTWQARRHACSRRAQGCPSRRCCACWCCARAHHTQERQLLAEGVAGWQQSYYMPGTSDTGVAAWRAW
jgi:hypothetical protein